MQAERLLFAKITKLKNYLFEILKKVDESKAPDIDDLSGIFVKQGASLLATPPITQLCNLSISSGTFLKMVVKRIPRTIVQSPSYCLSQKCWREEYMNKP